MISDTNFQKEIPFASGVTTHYFIVPYICTLRDVAGIVQASPGTSETITFTENSAGTALGVLAFGVTVAAGGVGTWTTDADTGDHVLAADEKIKMVTTAGSAADCHLEITLDPYARTT